MPIHDWTRVDAGIFHHFHHEWISRITRALNKSLPEGYYALAEQIAGGLGPDVLTLQRSGQNLQHGFDSGSTVAVATRPPKVKMRLQSEPDQYATRAKQVVIRHTSNHRVVAVIEIVSPWNKSSRHGLAAFVSKAVELLRGGIHMLILDLIPPGLRDPQGIHKAVWDELIDNEFVLPEEERLTLVAYRADRWPEAFVEPTAVGCSLPEMPVFLEPDSYVPLLLEPAYQSAWEAVPEYWQRVIASTDEPQRSP